MKLHPWVFVPPGVNPGVHWSIRLGGSGGEGGPPRGEGVVYMLALPGGVGGSPQGAGGTRAINWFLGGFLTISQNPGFKFNPTSIKLQSFSIQQGLR